MRASSGRRSSSSASTASWASAQRCAMRRRPADPARFRLEVRINGELKQSRRLLADWCAARAQLLADVGEFMTLRAGDVLMLGCDAGRPLARPGDRIEISAPGFETLRQHAGGGGSMKHARILFEGATHDAVEHDGQLLLADGRLAGLRCGDVAAAAGAHAAPAHHPRAGPELRRPRQGAGVQGAGGAAGLPQGRERADRPPPVHPPSRRRAVHALRMRAGDRRRQDRAAR